MRRRVLGGGRARRNLHAALYYKAGGVPWRLPPNSTDLTTCYVGVAFCRNSANATL